MAFRQGSLWNEQNEIRCLVVMKQLVDEGLPRGRQADYCRELAKVTGLPVHSLSAKVGNFKSLAGLTGPSNWSQNSEAAWKAYGHLSTAEIRRLLK